METDYAGIAAIPLVTGLVEGAKRFGLDAKWAFPLSLALGLMLSLGYAWAGGAATGKAWMDSVVLGLGFGLAASGLYSGGKATVETVRGSNG